MDTFMDKLAQKLTAQEMIKANTAADAEELQKLKGQVREYQELLEEIQKMVEVGAMKLENAKVDGSQIDRLVEESIAKINEMKADAQGVEKMQEAFTELEKALGTKLESIEDNVHKECVKVYRNVQAAVTEENTKQTESVVAAVNGLKGKLKAIFGISIAALVVAVGSVVFQILVYLHVI